MIYNEFIESLLILNHVTQIEKIGIFETNLCKYWDLNFHIDNLFIYNNTGEELIIYCSEELGNIYSKKNHLFKKLVISSYLINNTFSHIFLGNKKITIYKNFLTFIVVTRKTIKENLIKLYLEFISNVLFNFIGDNKDLKEQNLYNIAKIFEIFFVKYLTIKFTNIIKYLITRRENLIMNSQIKLKNIIFFDIKNNTIIFNFKSLFKKKSMLKKINNNSILWQTLINNLKMHKDYYSTKIELFSTFPRLSFILKYIKICNGIGIIESYSSNKLSRNASQYCEMEFSYQKTKNNNNNFNYGNIGKYLDNFENFLKLYFTSLSSKYYLYSDLNAELPYFDEDYLNIIVDALQIRMSFDNLINYLFKKIDIKLNLLDKNINKEKTSRNINNKNNFLYIDKSEILKSLYSTKIRSYENKFSIEDFNKVIDNNLNTNLDIFDSKSEEVSVIEKRTDEILSESLISEIKEKNSLISNCNSLIDEIKNNEILKKDKIDLLKNLQFKLVNFGENGSPLRTISSVQMNRYQFTDSDNISNSLFQVRKNSNNNIHNIRYNEENKINDSIDKIDLSEFYGDKSSQEILCNNSPTFANLNKKKLKK